MPGEENMKLREETDTPPFILAILPIVFIIVFCFIAVLAFQMDSSQAVIYASLLGALLMLITCGKYIHTKSKFKMLGDTNLLYDAYRDWDFHRCGLCRCGGQYGGLQCGGGLDHGPEYEPLRAGGHWDYAYLHPVCGLPGRVIFVFGTDGGEDTGYGCQSGSSTPADLHHVHCV